MIALDIRDDIVDYVLRLLRKYNIDPLYFFTLIIIAIALSYKNVYKDWDNIEIWRKMYALSAAFGAILSTIISILKLFKVIDL